MFYVYKDKSDENYVSLDHMLEVLGYQIKDISPFEDYDVVGDRNDIIAYFDLEVEEIGINPESTFYNKLKEG